MDEIEQYYRRYQELKEETLNSKEYERKLQAITGNSSSSKTEIKKRLKGLMQDVMHGYSKELKPFLEKIFDRFDVKKKGYLSREEANNMFRVYLLKERNLRANHNAKLKLIEFEKTRYLELRQNFIKLDSNLDKSVNEDTIAHAIEVVYRRDYLPKVKQLWHDMYDNILANKNDLFGRSLFIEIDSDFDGKLLRHELVKNFTESFVHLTHSGIKNIAYLERKFYQDEFSLSLNEKVKKLLSQKIKEQVAAKHQHEKAKKENVDIKPEEPRESDSSTPITVAKMKTAGQKPLKLKLRKMEYIDDGELLEPNQLSLLCLCFVVAIIAVVLVGDFSLLNAYMDKIMNRGEL